MVVASLFEVTFQFDYEPADVTSTYHCASLDGAHRLVNKMVSRGDVIWYSIEGQNFIPCDDDDPDGQLYIGLTHFEFKELRKGDCDD